MSHYTVPVTDQTFEQTVLKSSQPVLVDFWAPWCGPCVSIGPVLEDIARVYQGKAVVAKMNVDENAHTPVTYGVRSIPYLALFQGGQIVDSAVGAVPKTRLTAMLDKVVAG